MFDMNPLNLPGVVLQHGVMLFVAGMFGFIIGYIGRKSRIAELEDELGNVQRDLADSRRVLIGTGDQEVQILRRVQARAGELDLDRIGRAVALEADDLKGVVGIGPFLEKKLHAIGIYTFRQIANFTREDVDKVNDIIEFFPGRIKRDNWVGQAIEIERKKRLQ